MKKAILSMVVFCALLAPAVAQDSKKSTECTKTEKADCKKEKTACNKDKAEKKGSCCTKGKAEKAK